MATAAELLSKIDLFADLDRGELRDVAGGTKEYSFAAGREIVSEGQSGVGFFVISSGTASVSVGGATVRTLGPGDYFGEVALIAEAPRTASVTAESDVTAYGISSWAFRPIVENNGKLAWKLLQVLAKHLSSR
ncbi:MAG TPA: cyclic nucleotide-binding domain-containing protein [Gaiellaceae bacterium]|jgi:CRP-like cAMP-binding protein|nr:cyclic nucleotide-binding domain-containing protein [Gaiellaceae bacterium]